MFIIIFAELQMRLRHWKQFYWIMSLTSRKMIGMYVCGCVCVC